MKGFKKSMVLAMATAALGATLLAGGTFAIFTSTAENTGNSFAAGTVKVSLDKPQGTHYFDVTNIAPGDSASSNLTVKNDGTLDLYYDINTVKDGVLAAGPNGLQVTIEPVSQVSVSQNSHLLAAGAHDDYKVTWSLPLAAGNEYQGASATLAITVNAEQARNNAPAVK